MPITFPLIPDVGLRESWEWKTDVITTIDGTEQRVSIRPRPRISQTANFSTLTQAEKRTFLTVLATNIKNVFETALYAYSTRITQTTLDGNDTIFFNPALLPIADGGILMLFNIQTGDIQQFDIFSVNADGATLTANVVGDIDSSYIVTPAMEAIIADGAGFSLDSITGDLNIQFDSWVDPAVQRQGTVASLTTYDSLPVLERNFLVGADQDFSFPREFIDGDAGIRRFASQYNQPLISTSWEFIIQRVLDPADFDYWRLFFDTVKGSWKPFLKSTQEPDLSLSSGLVQGGTSVSVNEIEHSALLHPYEIYRRIEIEYGDKTISRHTISSSTNGTFTVTPAIPNDPKVATVNRISYLLKMRMDDTLTFNHGSLVTEVRFDVVTTNEG